MSNESKPLSELLDEIEARAEGHAIRNTGCKCALCQSIRENLSLVKALRRAHEMIYELGDLADVSVYQEEQELSALLTLPVEQQQKKDL